MQVDSSAWSHHERAAKPIVAIGFVVLCQEAGGLFNSLLLEVLICGD